MATILIVEKRPNQQLLYQMVLEDDGHCVQVASTGHEALQILNYSTIDLVVLDPELPDMSGISLWHRMNTQRLRTPVMVYCCCGMLCKENQLARKAACCLTKSSNIDLLSQKVHSILTGTIESI